MANHDIYTDITLRDGSRIRGVPNPLVADEAANKAYVDSNSGSGIPIVSATIDFGDTVTKTSQTFDIPVAGCITTQKVMITQDSSMGDADFDLLGFAAHIPVDETVRVFAHSLTGLVSGQFKINIQVK